MAPSPDFLPTIAGVNASVLIAVALDWRSSTAAETSAAVQAERRRAVKATVVVAGLTCLYAVFVLAGLDSLTNRFFTVLFVVTTTTSVIGLWFVYFHQDANAFITKADAVISWPTTKLAQFLRAVRRSLHGAR